MIATKMLGGAVVMGLLCLANGCTSYTALVRAYPGPVRDMNDIALIHRDGPVGFVEIDGVKRTFPDHGDHGMWEMFNTGWYFYCLTPGEHVLLADCLSGVKYGTQEVKLTAKPGHVYELRARVSEQGNQTYWQPYILDWESLPVEERSRLAAPLKRPIKHHVW